MERNRTDAAAAAFKRSFFEKSGIRFCNFLMQNFLISVEYPACITGIVSNITKLLQKQYIKNEENCQVSVANRERKLIVV